MKTRLTLTGLVLSSLFLAGRAPAAETIKGQVLGGGAPIANSRVTLYAATAREPKQLAQTRTNHEGQFELRVTGAPADSSLYIVVFGGKQKARGGGDNPAIGLLAVLASKPPTHVVISEMTTVASVWTNAQFLVGATLRGPALGLRIAVGNVSNFVNLTTGGSGEVIQSPLNSSQTPTMANFATLADLLSACVARVTPNACSTLFAATTPPGGSAPTDTLNAPEAIALYPWFQPERLYALLDQFYTLPKGENMRPVPFMPYLNYAPSAWVLPLKFDGGGYRAGGKCMFDSEGNLWVGDNFSVGWQGSDALWQGTATKFAPDGHPLSPITTGFAGGGMEGGTFGAAVDSKDNAWFTTYGRKAIGVFDKTGKPLTGPQGMSFGGHLGLIGDLDPLRRPGHRDLLRYGKASASSADWAGTSVLKWRKKLSRRRTFGEAVGPQELPVEDAHMHKVSTEAGRSSSAESTGSTAGRSACQAIQSGLGISSA